MCEPLGMVAHNLYPELLTPLDELFRRKLPDRLDVFWHGVGRGIYFWPGNLSPFLDGDGRALKRIAALADQEEARRNAVAGLAWAMALVNLDRPRITAFFLSRHGHQPEVGDPVANGIASALIVWNVCAPGDPALEDFINFRPGNASISCWRTLVSLPVRDAIENELPALRKRNHLGRAFRYPYSSY